MVMLDVFRSVLSSCLSISFKSRKLYCPLERVVKLMLVHLCIYHRLILLKQILSVRKENVLKILCA